MIPQRKPGETFACHQHQMATWMGYFDPDAMNRQHDATHRSLCAWLGIESQALRDAAGEPLTPKQQFLADIEEAAVCCVQRLIAHTGVEVPDAV